MHVEGERIAWSLDMESYLDVLNVAAKARLGPVLLSFPPGEHFLTQKNIVAKSVFLYHIIGSLTL